MKKILLLALLLSVSGYSQQLKPGKHGSVNNPDGQKVKPKVVRDLMQGNPAALDLYQAGRDKKTNGYLLLYGGLGSIVANLVGAIYFPPDILDKYGRYTDARTKPTLAIVGGAMMVASIPVLLGYKKKINAAVDQYNEGLACNKVKPEMTIVANGNGVGVSIKF
ncbi:MAG TPA: hypothetical protein VF581_10860 [Flavobacterium sp.]|jgi:hypothetical protein